MEMLSRKKSIVARKIFWVGIYACFAFALQSTAAAHADEGKMSLPPLPPENKVVTAKLEDYVEDVKGLYAQTPEVLARCAKYRGAWVEVSGIIGEFDLDERLPNDWAMSITVKTDEPFSTKLALCFPDSSEPWKKVGKGSKVTVRGVHAHNGALYHCRFKKVEGKPCLEVTAEKITKEFTANAESTKQKYHDQYVVVTGQVEKPFEDNGNRTVASSLKGVPKLSLKVENDGPGRNHYFKGIKVGDKVSLIGLCEVNPDDKGFPIGLRRVCPTKPTNATK